MSCVILHIVFFQALAMKLAKEILLTNGSIFRRTHRLKYRMLLYELCYLTHTL